LIPYIRRVNIEFMARGEPLANPHVLKHWSQIHDAIAGSVHTRPWFPAPKQVKYHISTIMPDTFAKRSLVETFLHTERECWPTIYYSAWSIDPNFKRRWMPRALPVSIALSKLVEYQRTIAERTGDVSYAETKVRIHGAYVHEQNDSLSDVQHLVDAMQQLKLVARFNVIRYNPPTVGPFAQFKEASEERRRALVDWLRVNNVGGVKEIDRVGQDVYASCGTFIPK
jgi:adenine C2-methylase RlmN of 23S rRNA A2503 and tRNA A37